MNLIMNYPKADHNADYSEVIDLLNNWYLGKIELFNHGIQIKNISPIDYFHIYFVLLTVLDINLSNWAIIFVGIE